MFTITNCNKVLASSISILIFLLGTLVYAGTTGKIAGKIIDKATGEALIGANVLIVGTTMGAVFRYRWKLFYTKYSSR